MIIELECKRPMRLKPDKVQSFSESILQVLKVDPDCQFIRDEQMIHDDIRRIFMEDLRREDAIEEEIRDKLDAHRDKIGSGTFSYMDLFRKAKKQIARDRKLVF